MYPNRVCPGHELAGVGAVGPDPGDGFVPGAQEGQGRAGTVTVLDVGGGHDHDQQQPDRVHHDMAFAAGDFLARIESAAAGADGFGGPHRLRIHYRCGRFAGAAFGEAELFTQVVVDREGEPAAVPAGEDRVHGAPSDPEIDRQVPPLDAIVDDIGDRVEDLAAAIFFRVPATRCGTTTIPIGDLPAETSPDSPGFAPPPAPARPATAPGPSSSPTSSTIVSRVICNRDNRHSHALSSVASSPIRSRNRCACCTVAASRRSSSSRHDTIAASRTGPAPDPTISHPQPPRQTNDPTQLTRPEPLNDQFVHRGTVKTTV